MVGRDHADRDDIVRAGDDGVGGHRDHRVEVAGGQRVAQIAEIVGKECLHQREVGAQREFRADSSCRSLRSVACRSPPACRCRLASGCRPARVPPARMRSISVPCGTSSTSSSPAIICRWVSGLRPIWLTMALRSSLASTSLPMPSPRRRSIVGDHGEIAFVLPHDLIDDALGRADGHETADHQARAVRDHRDGLFERDGSHGVASFHRRSAIARSSRRPPAAPTPRICAAASEQRNTAKAPICSGVANSCDGCFSDSNSDFACSTEIFSREARSLICFSTSGVRTQPGQMALQVIPVRGGLERHHLGQPEHAMLGRDIGGLFHRCHQPVRRGDVDDAAPIALAHLRERRADRVKIRRQVDGDDGIPAVDWEAASIGAVCWMPALLTRISTRPSSRVAASTICAISVGLVSSAGLNAALTPKSLTICARSFSIAEASPKPFNITSAPAAPNARAMPRPYRSSSP